MANSTCVKCNNTTFELKQANIIGSQYLKYFIQCAKCGGVVGVIDYYDLSSLLKKLANKLGISI